MSVTLKAIADHDLAAVRAEYSPMTDEDRAVAAEGLAGLQSVRDKLEIDNAIRQNDEAFPTPTLTTE